MIKKLLKPSFILGFVLALQVLVLCLFKTGFVPSFTLDSSNMDALGIAVYFFFSIASFVILHALSSQEIESIDPCLTSQDCDALVDQRKLLFIVRFLLLLSVLGCLYLLGLTMPGYSVPEYFQACISNQIKFSLDLANGPLHLFLVFPMVNSVLTPLRSGIKWRGPLLLNIVCLALLSTIFGSRILFFEGLICSAVVLCSRFPLNIKLTVKSVATGAVISLAVFLIFATTSGLRDYEFEGYLYTDSPIVWGVSRVLDYPCSTLIYTSHFIDLASIPGNIFNVFPSLERISFFSELLELSDTTPFLAEFGKAYYTNLGCFPELVYKTGLWSVVIALSLIVSCARLYKDYCEGSLAGLLFYPFFLYGLLEYWRTFHLGYELIQIALLLLLFIYAYIKPSEKRKRC